MGSFVRRRPGLSIQDLAIHFQSVVDAIGAGYRLQYFNAANEQIESFRHSSLNGAAASHQWAPAVKGSC